MMSQNQLARSWDYYPDSDLETALSRHDDISNVNVLKQVVTDPDYAAREVFLGMASPKTASV